VLLRVATFNIHHGVGLDGVLDLGRTAEVVRATGAAVVGLQEVDRHLSVRSGWVDQAGWLAERLGMHVAYGANIDLDPDDRQGPGAPRRHYGNAVLSAHPIDAWRNVPLPGRDGAEPRGLLVVRLSVEGTAVVVGCTHLQNRSPGARRAQAPRVVEVLAPGGAAEATVLVGDMNAGPDSPEVRTLTAAFTDAWAVAGVVTDPGGEAGPLAADRADGLTFDAATPHARIDYVLTSGPVRPQAAWVVPTDASDHRPVVADLVL
jgi:endonuclease/exonuclease/phosphatase family metal-dependent hydrolase